MEIDVNNVWNKYKEGKFMAQNKNIKTGCIMEEKFTFLENGVVVKTQQEEDGLRRDIYFFLDGSTHEGAWYKDEYDTSGKLLKRGFLLDDGKHNDVYFEDGELKKVIKHFGNGKKEVCYFNKTKDRFLTCFDECGLMKNRMVWNVNNDLILYQEFYENGVMAKFIFFNSKNLPGYVDVFNKDGKKLYTEFPPNEKGETRRRVYCNEKSHIEVYNSSGDFLYKEYLLDNSKYHSMRVYSDGDMVKAKAYLDKNDVVREQSFYHDGIIMRTEFLNTEGVIVGIIDYDALGNIKTARQLDNEKLKYTNVELVATNKIPEVVLREENLLPYNENIIC